MGCDTVVTKPSAHPPGSSEALYSHLALRLEVWDFVPLHHVTVYGQALRRGHNLETKLLCLAKGNEQRENQWEVTKTLGSWGSINLINIAVQMVCLPKVFLFGFLNLIFIEKLMLKISHYDG